MTSSNVFSALETLSAGPPPRRFIVLTLAEGGQVALATEDIAGARPFDDMTMVVLTTRAKKAHDIPSYLVTESVEDVARLLNEAAQ